MRDLAERSPSPAVGGTDGVGKPVGPRLDGPADAGGGGCLEGAGRRAVTPGRGLLPRRRKRGRAGNILGRAGVPTGSWGAARLPGRELRGASWRGLIAPARPGLEMPGLDARRSGTRASPLANFRVDRFSPVPGRARSQGRERPGQAQPHLPGSTLRSPRTKLCGLFVSEPARCSVPAALWSGKAALPSSRYPVDPGRSPAARDEGRGQPGPTPASHRAAPPTCAQPLSGFLLQSLSG